jgi:hypothetical protein
MDVLEIVGYFLGLFAYNPWCSPASNLSFLPFQLALVLLMTLLYWRLPTRAKRKVRLALGLLVVLVCVMLEVGMAQRLIEIAQHKLREPIWNAEGKIVELWYGQLCYINWGCRVYKINELKHYMLLAKYSLGAVFILGLIVIMWRPGIKTAMRALALASIVMVCLVGDDMLASKMIVNWRVEQEFYQVIMEDVRQRYLTDKEWEKYKREHPEDATGWYSEDV